MSETRFYISVLVMVAVLFVGISPACAFMSGGNGVIQICAPDGSVQDIKVDEALDPFASNAPPADPMQHLETMENCPFCFADSHQAKALSDTAFLSFVLSSNYIVSSGGMIVPLGDDLRVNQPRGPPVLS